MATSGSFNTSGYSASDGSIYLVFSWTRTAVSVENNTSTISWTLKGGGTSRQWFRTGGMRVVLDGSTVYQQGSTTIALESGETVASGTKVLTHNADGSRSFAVSVSGGIYYYTGNNASGSQTFTIDTIPRASQPSCVTWPEHTQNVGNFGDTISIHMNRKSDAFTHVVRYAFGDQMGTIASGVTTGTTWTIPLSFMNLIPNSLSGSGTIYVDTYNGSQKVGTKYCGFTATVGANVKPTVSLSLDDTTGADDIYGSPVQGLSKIKITVNTTPAYSSPIMSYDVSANGAKYSTAQATTGVLVNSGASPVTVTVKDQRGRTASASYTMNVQAYTPPQVPLLSVHRCNADGTENDQGAYIEVTFSAQVSAMSNKNTAAYKLSYKKTSATSWTTVTLSALANKFSVNSASYIFAADLTDSYDVELSVTDRHKTTKRATSASTAFALIDFHESGEAIRFGGIAEEKGTFQNDLVFKQTKNQYCFAASGADGTDGFILMARITINAAEADSPMTFEFIRRKASASMTVHVCFASSSSTDPSVSKVSYEGSNYGAYLTKSAARVWDLYVRKVDASDVITLSRWYTTQQQMQKVSVEFVGTIASQVPTGLVGYHRATPLVVRSIIDTIMPVGHILMLYSHADPNEMYSGTTWVRIENAFLWGVDSTGTIGLTSGEKTHALTVEELPVHSHGSVYSGNVSGTKTHAWLASGGSNMAYGTVSTGSGAAHNNMPPYVQVSIWRRTA